MTLTLTDLFCGAGGSSTGAIAVPGVSLRIAGNHWDLAVETHNVNHPGADHLCADLAAVDPRRFPKTDILWASPECTNHSVARGKRRADAQPDLFGEVLPDAAAERSRATMWDVPRFTSNWEPFRAWLMAMDSLGYDHHVVFLNSMHAQAFGPGAPQSRDRMYVVFWRKGNQRPEIERVTAPAAVCADHGQVRARQVFKRPDRAPWGRYRAQYVYICGTTGCQRIVEPAFRPAADIIDWTLRGQRIEDRDRPLAAKTLARIQVGIDRYWAPFLLEAAGNTYDAANPRHPAHGRPDGYYRAWPVDEPVRTIHTTLSKALAVPVEGREGGRARPMDEPLRTQTARNETGLAFIAELRGGGSIARSVSDPLATVTASGNHHGLVTTYYGNGGMRPAGEALATVTATERHGLLTNPTINVDDVLFRMLEPREIAGAMDFPRDYRILGNRREQVLQSGNAVTPCAARDLVGVVAESLGVAS